MKALHMSGFLVREPGRKSSKTDSKHFTQLCGGIGNKPLTERQIKEIKERKQHAVATAKMAQTIAKLRAERASN